MKKNHIKQLIINLLTTGHATVPQGNSVQLGLRIQERPIPDITHKDRHHLEEEIPTV